MMHLWTDCAPEKAKAQRASLGWVFFWLLVLGLLLLPGGMP